ncbi:phage tail protein [Ligilactobacillus agilis]
MVEEINTANQLTFSVMTNSRIDTAIQYVCIPAPRGDAFLMFKLISETVKNDRVEYTAVESAYDELKAYSYIKDMRPSSKTAGQMLEQAIQGTRWSLGYIADTNQSSTSFYYITVLEAIQKIVELFNVELTFDVNIDKKTNVISSRRINLYTQQGERTGKRFEYGSNLLEVTREQSSENLITALVGRGKGEEVSQGEDGSPDGYGRRITFTDVEWKKADGNPTDKPRGQEYVEDKDATALYGFSDGRPRIGLTTFEDITDPQELLKATWASLQIAKRPQVAFKASVLDVGDLGLGDTVAIIRHDLGIEYFTRVYKVEYDLLNKANNTIELGDDFSQKSLTNYVADVTKIAENVKNTAEYAVSSASGKNKNYYSRTKPQYANEGDNLFLDLGNGETELYAWHNGNWELVVSTADTTAVKRQVEQAQADLAQVRADANRISETQTESAKRLDEQMQELRAKTSDNATNMQNVIRDVAQAHADYVAQQADISKQKADLEKTQQDLLANSESIEDFKGKVSKFQVDLDGINSQVANNTGAINQFKITENEINQAMKDAQGNIETLKLTADGFKQQFADTNGNIATIKRNVTELSEQLASKVGNTEYQNFKTQTAKELSQKLVRTDLNGYATTAEVKLTADGLKEQYNSVQSKVDGLKIGGVNLINNGGNPKDTGGWGIWGANTSHRFIVNRHAFWKNAQETLFTLFNSNSSEVTMNSNRFQVERNTEYTLSYWAFEDSNVISSDTFFLGRKNGETSDFTKVIGLVSGRVYSTVKAEYVTVTFNTGEVDEGYIRFDNNGTKNVGHEGGLYLANIKLEKGTVATPWTPAFEDLATVVSLNKVIDTADSHTQIIKDYLTNDNSQFKLLKNAVNLKVEKGDVIGQINLEAGKTLIQNQKVYLDADTVVFSNKAFIPSAAITDLSADKITTGTLNAASVKVINLDASKITTGKLNGMAVKIDGKTSEIDMTTDRGVIFRQKNGTWATTLTSYQIQFENNSSGQSEILGSLTAQYNIKSKNINGIGIVIPTQQKLGAPYGGDEFSIGYATDRNGHSTSDFIYNASGQVRSKGFHWYESSHLYGKAQILYIDGAHDPLWIRGAKFDKSSQNGYYQPTISAGWGGNTYGNSGISFLWDSILLYGSVQLGNIRVADATNAIGVGWTSWSDWNNEKYPSFTNENGSNHGGIAFPPNGNTVVWSGMTGQRQNTWK